MIFELIVTAPVGDVNLTDFVLSYKDQASYNLEQFPIGQVPSKMVNIQLDNGEGHLSEFISADDLLWTITLGNTTGKYKVVERPEKYTGTIEVTFQDLILETEQPYKSELEYPTNITAQLAEMASITGLQIDGSTLSTVTQLTEVNWIDTRVSIRDYLSWIAELDAKNVEIDSQGIIKFKGISDTPVHTTEDVESFVFDKEYSISKVRKDDGVAVLEVGSEDDYVLFLQSSNNYITTESQVAAILDSLSGKSWHSVNDFKMVGYDKLKLGDVIESGDIKFIAMSIDTTWSGGEYAIQVIQGPITPGNIQRTISVYDDRARINRIQTTIDEQKQELTILAEKQEDTSAEVAALTINSSQISLRVSSVEETAENTADDLENYKDEVADAINTIELTPGPQGPQGVQGPKGDDGISQYVHIRYSINENGDPMTESPGATTKYIGLANTTSETAPTGYASYTWSLFKGSDGEDGEDGVDGVDGIPGEPGEDGNPNYTWVKYADDEFGGNMSDFPAGKMYIGLAFNKLTDTESNDPLDYQWSAMYDLEALADVENRITTAFIDITDDIRMEVSESYVPTSSLDEYKNEVSTQFTQTSTDYTYLFNQLETYVQTLDGDTQAQFIEITKYIRFVDGKIVLGEINNPFSIEISNEEIGFWQSGARVAYIKHSNLYIENSEFLQTLRIGNFEFTPRANGNLSFGKVQ